MWRQIPQNLIQSYKTSKMTTQQLAYNQVAVINRNFCLRRSADLNITKNIWQIGQGNYVVKNSNGKIMFKIEGSIFNFNRTRVMSDATGVPIITLRKKVQFNERSINKIWDLRHIYLINLLLYVWSSNIKSFILVKLNFWDLKRLPYLRCRHSVYLLHGRCLEGQEKIKKT